MFLYVYSQQDAVEFLLIFLDIIWNTNPILTKDFDGKLYTTIDGINSNYHAEAYDNFVVIPCEIVHSHNLIDSLTHFTRISEMKGNNPWYIDENTPIDVTLCTRIFQAPKILFFHLQRF
jgi:ubiquitin C-terminal hydrolase